MLDYPPVLTDDRLMLEIRQALERRRDNRHELGFCYQLERLIDELLRRKGVL